jgi:hypothetical protein
MSDPFDEYATRLLAWDDARQKAFDAVVGGDDAADSEAWWLRTRVTEHELDVAQAFLLGFRLAVTHYPTETMQWLDELNRISAEFWERTQEAKRARLGQLVPDRR